MGRLTGFTNLKRERWVLAAKAVARQAESELSMRYARVRHGTHKPSESNCEEFRGIQRILVR